MNYNVKSYPTHTPSMQHAETKTKGERQRGNNWMGAFGSAVLELCQTAGLASWLAPFPVDLTVSSRSPCCRSALSTLLWYGAVCLYCFLPPQLHFDWFQQADTTLWENLYSSYIGQSFHCLAVSLWVILIRKFVKKMFMLDLGCGVRRGSVMILLNWLCFVALQNTCC